MIKNKYELRKEKSENDRICQIVKLKIRIKYQSNIIFGF